MPTRTVRHLRLRAADDAAVRRAALLLEDALRTASLPDAGARLLLVRRLALGRIARDIAPQGLALALEREVAKLATTCVHADAPLAPAAPAVWFRDALDAHTALALRLLGGDAADAWYWPLAVPAWRRDLPLSESLRRLAHSLAALPEAPAALPQWVAAISRAGGVDRLVAALRPDDVAVLARAAGVAPAPGDDGSSDVRAARAEPGCDARRQPSPASSAPAARRAGTAQESASPARRRPGDPRLRLVRALLAAAGAADTAATNAKLSSPRELASDRSSPPPTRHGAPRSSRDRVVTGDADSPARARSDVSSQVPVRRGESSTSTASAAARAAAGAPPISGRPRADSAEPRAERTTTAQPAYDLDGAETDAGGLLFLLPVLVRLGYADWLDAHPEWADADLARRILATALARLKIDPGDPAWTLAVPALRGRVPRRFVAPSIWRGHLDAGRGPPRLSRHGGFEVLWDAAARLPLAAWRGPCPRALVGERRRAAALPARAASDIVAVATLAWLIACRRWLRRYAGLGLADLVRRTAALAATPTHLDVTFDHAQADLCVRRAGLDLDPGWLPWLGRVVGFHYVSRTRS